MSRRELEAALRRDLGDEQAWTVFGDLLAEAGDSRGELIALEQRARASERPFERALLEHQARELFDREHRSWLGPLASAGLEVSWTRGFATQVVIARAHASTLATLLELPTAALLRRLVLDGPKSLARVARILAGRDDRPIASLVVRNVGDESLEALATLGALTELCIEGTALSNLASLAELPGLRSLALRRCAGELVGLSGFSRLRKLEVSAHQNVVELGDALAPLVELRSLRELDLGDAGWPSADPLVELIELERLDLRSTEILSLEPLRGLERLRELNCSGCTGLTNLEPLGRLLELERLRLGYTRVHDLRPLTRLERLAILELAGTAVTDVAPLLELPGLRKVDLKACEVHDVARLVAKGVTVHGIRAPERTWREVAEEHLRRR